MSNATATTSSRVTDPVFQNAYYVGNNVNGILYGVELVLYFVSIKHLLSSWKLERKRLDMFFMCFSTAMLVSTTIFVAVQAVFGQEMWVVNADFPGGMEAYLEQYASVWYQTMGTTSTVVLNLLGDGLMIYRCYVIWNDYWVIAFPCLLYVGTLGLGIAQLYTSGSPSGNFFAGLAADLGLAYSATTIGLNVIVTLLICGRILFFARRSQRMLGRAAMRPYTGTVALIIESALPYSAFGATFLVTYGLNSQLSILFLSFYILLTCLSSQLIILRVVGGRAWNSKYSQSGGNLTFTHRSGISAGDAAGINLRTIVKTTEEIAEVHMPSDKKFGRPSSPVGTESSVAEV